MPDVHRFDHLPRWGVVTVRCIEDGCAVGGPLYEWPEARRRRHAEQHVRQVRLERERAARARARQARTLARQAERENEQVYGNSTR